MLQALLQAPGIAMSKTQPLPARSVCSRAEAQIHTHRRCVGMAVVTDTERDIDIVMDMDTDMLMDIRVALDIDILKAMTDVDVDKDTGVDTA